MRAACYTFTSTTLTWALTRNQGYPGSRPGSAPVLVELISSGKSDTLQTIQFSSVVQSCPTLCDPMNCSTPGLPAVDLGGASRISTGYGTMEQGLISS